MTLHMVMLLYKIPKAQSMKEIRDNLDLIEIKYFCSVEDNNKGMRRQCTDWEKIFAKDLPTK